MKVFISFLRGVNMAGHNSIKMKDLTELFVSMGFSDAVTYIQSGNVIFSDANFRSHSEITAVIETAIYEKFGYNIPSMLRTRDELKEIILFNPYQNDENYDPSKAAVVLLHEPPDHNQINKVLNIEYPPDRFLIKGSEIFIYCPNGFGRTKLYTNFFENKMGVVGTSRNAKTITAIFGITEKIPFANKLNR
jgi:uncharacterized protein (DUF1697 family)